MDDPFTGAGNDSERSDSDEEDVLDFDAIAREVKGDDKRGEGVADALTGLDAVLGGDSDEEDASHGGGTHGADAEEDDDFLAALAAEVTTARDRGGSMGGVDVDGSASLLSGMGSGPGGDTGSVLSGSIGRSRSGSAAMPPPQRVEDPALAALLAGEEVPELEGAGDAEERERVGASWDGVISELSEGCPDVGYVRNLVYECGGPIPFELRPKVWSLVLLGPGVACSTLVESACACLEGSRTGSILEGGSVVAGGGEEVIGELWEEVVGELGAVLSSAVEEDAWAAVDGSERSWEQSGLDGKGFGWSKEMGSVALGRLYVRLGLRHGVSAIGHCFGAMMLLDPKPVGMVSVTLAERLTRAVLLQWFPHWIEQGRNGHDDRVSSAECIAAEMTDALVRFADPLLAAALDKAMPGWTQPPKDDDMNDRGGVFSRMWTMDALAGAVSLPALLTMWEQVFIGVAPQFPITKKDEGFMGDTSQSSTTKKSPTTKKDESFMGVAPQSSTTKKDEGFMGDTPQSSTTKKDEGFMGDTSQSSTTKKSPTTKKDDDSISELPLPTSIVTRAPGFCAPVSPVDAGLSAMDGGGASTWEKEILETDPIFGTGLRTLLLPVCALLEERSILVALAAESSEESFFLRATLSASPDRATGDETLVLSAEAERTAQVLIQRLRVLQQQLPASAAIAACRTRKRVCLALAGHEPRDDEDDQWIDIDETTQPQGLETASKSSEATSKSSSFGFRNRSSSSSNGSMRDFLAAVRRRTRDGEEWSEDLVASCAGEAGISLPDAGRASLASLALPKAASVPVLPAEVLPSLATGWRRDVGLRGGARSFGSTPLFVVLDVRPASHRRRGRFATAVHVAAGSIPGGVDAVEGVGSPTSAEGVEWSRAVAIVKTLRDAHRRGDRPVVVVVMGVGARLLWRFYPSNRARIAAVRDAKRCAAAAKALHAAGIAGVTVLEGGYAGAVRRMRRGLSLAALVDHDPPRCPVLCHVAATALIRRHRASAINRLQRRAKTLLEPSTVAKDAFASLSSSLAPTASTAYRGLQAFLAPPASATSGGKSMSFEGGANSSKTSSMSSGGGANSSKIMSSGGGANSSKTMSSGGGASSSPAKKSWMSGLFDSVSAAARRASQPRALEPPPALAGPSPLSDEARERLSKICPGDDLDVRAFGSSLLVLPATATDPSNADRATDSVRLAFSSHHIFLLDGTEPTVRDARPLASLRRIAQHQLASDAGFKEDDVGIALCYKRGEPKETLLAFQRQHAAHLSKALRDIVASRTKTQ